MDFITKLLILRDNNTNIKYYNILIIINKLTKYAHFILYLENL